MNENNPANPEIVRTMTEDLKEGLSGYIPEYEKNMPIEEVIDLILEFFKGVREGRYHIHSDDELTERVRQNLRDQGISEDLLSLEVTGGE